MITALSLALKFMHVATIALWSAGLVALPLLFVLRNGMEGERLHNLHAFTRFLFVVLLSPAAFVAIASGGALIFVQGIFALWFSAKLALVALLCGIHILCGLVILKLFRPEGRYPMWRAALAVPAISLVVVSILIVVLWKPDLALPEGFARFFAPGALSEHAASLSRAMRS